MEPKSSTGKSIQKGPKSFKGKAACQFKPSRFKSKQSGRGAVLRTSNGLSTPELMVEFMRLLFELSGIEYTGDTAPSPELVESLKAKHAEFFANLKVVVLNDTAWFRSKETMSKLLQKKPEMFWDLKFAQAFGVKPENITIVELFGKPWLQDPKGPTKWDDHRVAGTRQGLHHAWSRTVDPHDGAAWDAAIEEGERIYAALKAADQKKGAVPPVTDPRYADKVLQLSQRLNAKYKDRMMDWWKEVTAGVTVFAGSGGDVVMLNFAYQLNQEIAAQLRFAVREQGCLYVGRSAGAMVTAQSIEVTNEIQPGWLEQFSSGNAFKARVGGRTVYSENDLDDEGVHGDVLGALKLTDTPFAVRPHFKADSYAREVLDKNRLAEAEFEIETGIEISDTLVDHSSGSGGEKDLDNAVKLLAKMQANPDQDNPVYLPVYDGTGFSTRIRDGKETFTTCTAGMPKGWHDLPFMERIHG